MIIAIIVLLIIGYFSYQRWVLYQYRKNIKPGDYVKFYRGLVEDVARVASFPNPERKTICLNYMDEFIEVKLKDIY